MVSNNVNDISMVSNNVSVSVTNISMVSDNVTDISMVSNNVTDISMVSNNVTDISLVQMSVSGTIPQPGCMIHCGSDKFLHTQHYYAGHERLQHVFGLPCLLHRTNILYNNYIVLPLSKTVVSSMWIIHVNVCGLEVFLF